MKHLAWILPLLLAAAWGLAPRLSPARAEPPAEGDAAWEYRMLLIPLERHLDQYERANVELLEPLRRLGEEGWELVTAYEPSHGFLVRDRSTTEFWLKRRTVAPRRR